ncbi:hypothetical protein DRP53_09320 [candidate division WOR-3 bacterium]|uniref:NFACT protein RNA binding domain-containing protein n=1 Tax=candidate division WOR-3 bacterium TaxID=2052148 RepID=A0A660SEI9_UNCW3|nr:MAG: hypothetical protein DRP53_09320 [candidate division WOR-3 bacterium]
MISAVALFSGGLDSSLAIKIIQLQGIKVIGLHFTTPFCTRSGSACHRVAHQLGIELRNIPLGENFLAIVEDPPHGYGKNLNPCIDCRILMLKKAKQLMADLGGSFIITGEVLNQRPMTQNWKALFEIERQAGLEGLIERPLSARLLPETIPQQKGWVDRERLLAIQGRSRKKQFELARQFRIEEYSTPAGGCLLTDPIFCGKVRDLIEHNQLTLEEVVLLRLGRHFRLGPEAKLIVGRNEKENLSLLHLIRPDDIKLEPLQVKGPIAILRGRSDPQSILLAARIVARYSDQKDEMVRIEVRDHKKKSEIAVNPITDEEINPIRL